MKNSLNNHNENANVSAEELDQQWADLLSPTRRSWLRRGGVAAAVGLAGIGEAFAQQAGLGVNSANGVKAQKSPWGEDTDKEPTPQPLSVRPGEKKLPTKPRAYTDIKSYHAHIYFDEDNYQKAALLRK